MALKAYRFVGLNRDVYLPDDIEVIIDIIPDSMIGWVRSGTPNAPDYSTWHDTGNAGANALHERGYLHGGPTWVNPDTGRVERYKVGYNFAVDDKRIVQITPLNEDTWAAGTYDGNHTSWHVEQCFGDSIDFARSTRNCAALHGGLIAAMPGWELEPSLVQHNVWYGKDCPRQLRQRGEWGRAVAQAKEFFTAARKAAGGTTTPAPKPTPTTPAQTYVTPAPIPALVKYVGADKDTIPAVVTDGPNRFYVVKDRVRAIRDTPRLRYAMPSAERVGPDIRKGEAFDVAWLVRGGTDGHEYYITDFWTRVKSADVERVKD